MSAYKTGRNKTIFIDNLQKTADYFEISLDYLLGNTDIKEMPAFNEKDEHEITFDDFTYDDQNSLIDSGQNSPSHCIIES